MATISKTRSSRASGRRGGRLSKAAAPARATAKKTQDNGSATARGSRRLCEAPGCGKSFRAYVDRQRFCSNGCRSRAFYWDFKDKTGERYAAHLAGDGSSRGRRATRRAPSRMRRRPRARA
jgi:hypothetical protein